VGQVHVVFPEEAALHHDERLLNQWQFLTLFKVEDRETVTKNGLAHFLE